MVNVALVFACVSAIGIPVTNIAVDIALVGANVAAVLRGIGFVPIAQVAAQIGTVPVQIPAVGVNAALIAACIAQVGIAIGPILVQISAITVDVALIAIAVSYILSEILPILNGVARRRRALRKNTPRD